VNDTYLATQKAFGEHSLGRCERDGFAPRQCDSIPGEFQLNYIKSLIATHGDDRSGGYIKGRVVV